MNDIQTNKNYQDIKISKPQFHGVKKVSFLYKLNQSLLMLQKSNPKLKKRPLGVSR